MKQKLNWFMSYLSTRKKISRNSTTKNCYLERLSQRGHDLREKNK